MKLFFAIDGQPAPGRVADFDSAITALADRGATEIVMRHPHTLGFGLWPRIDERTLAHENGGIPIPWSTRPTPTSQGTMSGMIDRHLNVLHDSLRAYPPRPSSGYVCIDWEWWKEAWRLLEERYKHAALAAGLTSVQWEDDACTWLERSIAMCKATRPDLRFGFYALPWLFDSAARTRRIAACMDVSFPTAYLSIDSPLAPQLKEIETTIRARKAAYRNTGKPVIAFVRSRYNDRYELELDASAVRGTFKATAQADGHAIWDAWPAGEVGEQLAAAWGRWVVRVYLPEWDRHHKNGVVSGGSA